MQKPQVGVYLACGKSRKEASETKQIWVRWQRMGGRGSGHSGVGSYPQRPCKDFAFLFGSDERPLEICEQSKMM